MRRKKEIEKRERKRKSVHGGVDRDEEKMRKKNDRVWDTDEVREKGK